MDHLLLKATTTATDEGTFEAVISTATVDRDGDIVEPTAMVAALKKWAALGKLMPLAWVHTDEVIGHVDPASARIDGPEVVAKGWVDQEIPRGEEAWRLVKAGTLSFSFGYLIPDGGATKREGGRFHITELDVYEISVVPIGPANNDTRVLAYKSAEELRTEAQRIAREAEEAVLPEVGDAPSVEREPEPNFTKELQQVKDELAEARQILEELRKKADETAKEPHKARSVDPLREQADAVALEFASGGESLRKPPRKAATKPPELIPLGDLKQRMRDEMLLALSGDETP